MSFDTAAGVSLAIVAGPPATYDAVGYGATSPVVVGEVTNVGEFGKQFELVTHQPLATRGVKKAKGSFNNGSLNPQLALDEDDAGQIILNEALESDEPYVVSITMDNGDVYYMEALVMGRPVTIGGVDDIVTASPTLEITHNPIVFVGA